MNLSSGSIVDEKFEVLERLGMGGFGAVYKARHLHLDREIALKIAEQGAPFEDLQRFQREAQILCTLQHPRLPQIYGHGTFDGRPYFAMELLSGQSLQDLLNERTQLSAQEAVAITKQLVEGLQCAHNAGVIHRDLKPANIMIEGSTVKIIDFGLARITHQHFEEQQLTQQGMTIGSEEYMSPEQCLGKPVDQRADIYSVGCILYKMVAGRTPFVAEHASLLMKQHVYDNPPPLPAGNESLQQVIDRCLEKDADKRFANAAQLLAALPSGRSKAPNQALMLAGSIAITALIVGAVWLFRPAPVGFQDQVSEATVRPADAIKETDQLSQAALEHAQYQSARDVSLVGIRTMLANHYFDPSNQCPKTYAVASIKLGTAEDAYGNLFILNKWFNESNSQPGTLKIGAVNLHQSTAAKSWPALDQGLALITEELKRNTK